MLIDTHTHFYDEWLLPDAEAAVQRALEAGVGKMIQADIDSKERPAMWAIGERHPGIIFQMLGLYPGSVTTENWQEELLIGEGPRHFLEGLLLEARPSPKQVAIFPAHAGIHRQVVLFPAWKLG